MLESSPENTPINQIIIERFHLPDTGPFHIQVDFIGEIKVNANAARRKANTHLLTNVTNLSYAGRQPGLVLGERLVWRFPAMLALPSYGEIGPIGILDVDTTTGEILSLSPTAISQMRKRAHVLVGRLRH